LNTNLRNNILFGEVYDEQRYIATLAACQLIPDLEQLPAGTLACTAATDSGSIYL